MHVIEGQVRFRNRMGKATFMRVEQANGSLALLYFRRDDLGEDGYNQVKAVELDQTIRVAVGPEQQSRTGEMLLPVEQVIEVKPMGA
jgi:lysyl-tRNA synthetase class II